MRFLGHPLHSAIVHFPIAGWVFAAGADAAWLVTGDGAFLIAALWLQGSGLAAAGLAAIAGAADLGGLKRKPEAATAAMTHIAFISLALTAAGASLAGRLNTPPTEDLPIWMFAASFAAAALVLIGGYFGGTLVYRHGFGAAKTPPPE